MCPFLISQPLLVTFICKFLQYIKNERNMLSVATIIFYLLLDQLELSCWITHWLCLVLLILLGCSNSLLVRGVYIDAEEPAGKCVIFPCYYLRLIFQQERARKLAKHLQLDTITRKKQDGVENNVSTLNHITTISQLNATTNHVVWHKKRDLR